MARKPSITSHGEGRSAKLPVENLTWQKMSLVLEGVGDHRIHLDALRAYLPLELRNRLGCVLHQPWIASAWVEPCLRVIPQVLWNDYLRYVRAQISDEKRVYDLIIRPAQPIKSSQGEPRWRLPYTLTARIQIESGDACWLCPNCAWIEVWKEKIKLEYDQRAAAAVASAILTSPNSPNSPSNPDTSLHSARSLCPASRNVKS
jgi:hypothetical protein